MKPNETKTWQRTKTPGLLRHRGGRYYARLTLGGKTKFVPLKTDLLEIARQRFAEEKATVEKTRKAARATTSGIARMADLLELDRNALAARVDITEATRQRITNSVSYIEKTWPGFAEMRPDQVTRAEIEKWRARALKEGTGFRPPGAKSENTAVSGRSPSTFNKAVDALRRMLDLAVDAGSLHRNPLADRRGLKAKATPRKPNLPEASKLRDVFAEMERSGERGGWAKETADFCRFLAFTGCRLAEAGAVTWADVDFGRGVIRVKGTKTEAASREVPIIPAAQTLLSAILERRKKSATELRGGEPYVDLAAAVLAVKEASKSLTRACAAVGVPRLTHHDLRDAFATQAIEAGVDIPTVASWLGHVDGGALLMKVYAHHRREHSVAQAAKVNFG
jgi:integrase